MICEPRNELLLFFVQKNLFEKFYSYQINSKKEKHWVLNWRVVFLEDSQFEYLWQYFFRLMNPCQFIKTQIRLNAVKDINLVANFVLLMSSLMTVK